MPGILPMKVIKLGTTASERIAQACDRCRSKKIKCDGLAPACSQCTTVRFECKTSDKLSRRAFPRGYTESLEERVRSLELEIRELKDLLDEKDEKIDIISKLHSPQAIPQSTRSSAPPPNNTKPTNHRPSIHAEQRDSFKVIHAASLQVSPGGSDAHYTGSSSLRAFIDTFRHRVQESARPCAEFDSNQLVPACTGALPSCSLAIERQDFTVAPPRVLSDQMVNTFFQEWAPLFPVLHRPTFLKTYQQYVTDAGSIEDTRDIAQLNLVFCIGAFARESHVSADTARCAQHWRVALTTFDMETSMARLQCLILAQLYAIQRADWNDLYQFKSVAVGIALRLGLNMSQKRFVMGALSTETRKKVLWTLYTIDCFSAASLGLPRMLGSESIQCEYPCDVDDEYVTETGFQPTLPGEYTRLSSALALFRGSRVLAKVLDETYTASDSQELSLQGISALEEDLEAWYNTLAPHLKLEFLQDKPSTHVISSRCPLLSLTYQYIRILIHRHAVGAGIGAKAASSVVALASSSKRVVQILQLLEERNLSLSHCVNKDELLITAGFGLFYQNLELDEDCRLFKDTSKIIGNIVCILERDGKPSADAMVRLGCAFLPVVRSADDVDSPPTESSTGSLRRTSAELATDKQFQSNANRYTLVVNKDRLSRRTSHASIDAVARTSGAAQSLDFQDNRRAMHFVIPCSNSSNFPSPADRTFSSWSSSKRVSQSPAVPHVGKLNLDYFSFGHTPDPERETKNVPPSDTSDWTKLMNSLGEIHDGQAVKTSNLSLHDEPYSPVEHAYRAPPSISSIHEPLWDNDFWDLSASSSNVAPSSSSSIPSMTLSNDSLSEEDIVELLETSDHSHITKNVSIPPCSIPDTPLSGAFDFTKDVVW